MTGTESEGRKDRRRRILHVLLSELTTSFEVKLATCFPRRGDRIIAREIANSHPELRYVGQGRGIGGIVERVQTEHLPGPST